MKFHQSLFFNDNLWKLLDFIESHQNQQVPVKELHLSIPLSPQELPQYLRFLRYLNLDLNLNGEGTVLSIGKMEKISFEMSMSEWLAFQGHFPLLEGFNGKPFNDLLKNKLQKIEHENMSTSLFDALNVENEIMESLSENSSSFAAVLEEINQSNKIADLSLVGNKTLEVYPHKLVHIDGELNIVGEDIGDGCLIHFSLNSIQSVYEKDLEDYSPKYSSLEINDFVQAIRTVTGSEERLVMKIIDQGDQQFETGYHFMADPYITTNMDGDKIWAASVEVSDELYSWLMELGDKIEILDPSSIKDGLEAYRSGKESMKKAA